MSHFYGYIQGNRGEATRGGSKQSGYVATAASWEGAVRVQLHYDPDKKQDIAVVMLTPWEGNGVHRELFRGPVSGND